MKENNFGFDKEFNEFEITITSLENEKEVEIHCNKLKELYYYPIKKENRRIIGELLQKDFRITHLLNKALKKRDKKKYKVINQVKKDGILLKNSGYIKDYIELFNDVGYHCICDSGTFILLKKGSSSDNCLSNNLKTSALDCIDNKKIIFNKYLPGLKFIEFPYYTDTIIDSEPSIEMLRHDINKKPDIIIKKQYTHIPTKYNKQKIKSFRELGNEYEKFLNIEFFTINSDCEIGKNLYSKYIYCSFSDYNKKYNKQFFTCARSGIYFIYKTLNMCDTFREYFSDFISYPYNSYRNNPLYVQQNTNGGYNILDFSLDEIWGSHIRNRCNVNTFNELMDSLNLKMCVIRDFNNEYYNITFYKKIKEN